MKKSIVCLILAKRDSNRLPGKNILSFHGKPMYMVNILKCLKIFDRVYVSSDSKLMLKEAEGKGAIGILRDKELCGDTPNIPVYKNAWEYIDNADGFIAVQANSPTINSEIIVKAKEYLENGGSEVMTKHKNGQIYGSVWGMTFDRLKDYGDPYKPTPDLLIEDQSVDIHTREDYELALKDYREYN